MYQCFYSEMVKKKDDFGNVDKSAKIELHIVFGSTLRSDCLVSLLCYSIEMGSNRIPRQYSSDLYV